MKIIPITVCMSMEIWEVPSLHGQFPLKDTVHFQAFLQDLPKRARNYFWRFQGYWD